MRILKISYLLSSACPFPQLLAAMLPFSQPWSSWGRVCARLFHSCWLVALLIALLVLAELPSTAKITAYY
jgi:hypothetical protein